MSSIQNIKINGKFYELPATPVSNQRTYSGSVYRLQVEAKDMAIKIYRTEKEYEEEEQDEWFPSQKDMEKFIELSDEVRPILLSNMMVFDSKDHYIGCGSYYINEIKGNTQDIIFNLSCSKFFADIFALRDQIPYVSKNYIELDDWYMGNLKYGTIDRSPDTEKLYCFDDSNYCISKGSVDMVTNSNYCCLNRLALNILGCYFQKHHYLKEEYRDFLYVVKRYSNYFEFLEKESRGYSTLDEFLKDRVKKIYNR